MPGMNKYEDKERRKFRRRNHFAMSLGDPMYRSKKKKDVDTYDEDDGF